MIDAVGTEVDAQQIGEAHKQILLMWLVAHELFHVVRHHDEVARHHGNDVMTQRALEHDADNLAIAAVYRIASGPFGNFQPIVVKKLVFASVYCAISDWHQCFPYRLTDVHPRWSSRAISIAYKLVSLREGERTNWHLDAEWLRDTRELFGLFDRLQQGLGSLDSDLSAQQLWAKHIDVIDRWEDLKADVSRLSGTLTSLRESE